jgi:hypothetical protein
MERYQASCENPLNYDDRAIGVVRPGLVAHLPWAK